MIYFDNAATSGKKPQQVVNAVSSALKNMSANPGRGGYQTSKDCSEMIYGCRKKATKFFGCENEMNVIFTANCTTALNFVMKGILKKGDHCIISSFEHNAVTRPAAALAKTGVEFDVAELIPGDDGANVRAFQRLIRSNTRLAVCTHASNVTGDVFPIAAIGEMCAAHGILFAVDAAQTAGVLPIDMVRDNIDFLCVAPHKGLYAPMGTGMLISRKPIPRTLIEGGTGSESIKQDQPLDPPERFESGTVNVPGIAGISAGIDFIESYGLAKLYNHEISLAGRFYDGLSRISGARVYSSHPKDSKHVPTISFNLSRISSEETASILAEMGVATRAGLHCAPYAHKRIGTLDGGTVRVCFSAFNTLGEVDYALMALRQISKAKRR